MAKTAKIVTVDRVKVVAMLTALGVKKADKLSEEKMLGKLSQLDDTDDTIDPGKFRKTYEKIVTANEKGYEIEITGFEEAKPAKAAKASKAAPEKNGKASSKKAGKASKEEKPAKKKKPSAPAGPSNKLLCYKEWKSRKGDAKTDVEGIYKKVKPDTVKMTTLRAWMASWKRGENLPAGS